jgi:WhiB family redox-sensing transcriptional regulator
MTHHFVKIDYEQAACSDIANPEVFFPNSGEGYDQAVATAKKICASCPQKIDCFNHGIAYEKYGIWGGTTASERIEYRKKFHILLEPLD